MVKPSNGEGGEQVAEESCITPNSDIMVGGGGTMVSDDVDGKYICQGF